MPMCVRKNRTVGIMGHLSCLVLNVVVVRVQGLIGQKTGILRVNTPKMIRFYRDFKSKVVKLVRLIRDLRKPLVYVVRHDRGWCVKCESYRRHSKLHWHWKPLSMYGLESRTCMTCAHHQVINPFFTTSERVRCYLGEL